MKNLSRKIAVATVCSLTLGFIVFGCVTENENAELTDSAKIKKDAKFVVSSYDHLMNSLNQENSRFVIPSTLTQESIDNYLVQLNLQPGSVDVAAVTEIVSKLSDVAEQGNDAVIESTLYSTFTKEKLKEIAEGNLVENLEVIPEFADLSLSEKELLILCNNIAREYIETHEMRYGGNGDLDCPSSACGVAYAIIGATTGTAICGLPCGIVGGIIGLILGTAGK